MQQPSARFTNMFLLLDEWDRAISVKRIFGQIFREMRNLVDRKTY